MGLKFPCALLLVTALLAGCSAGRDAPRSDQFPPQEPSALTAEPASDKQEIFVDDSSSPYLMAVERWSVDMDGMGALVTTLSWADGQTVVLDQQFDWD